MKVRNQVHREIREVWREYAMLMFSESDIVVGRDVTRLLEVRVTWW